MRIHVPRIFLYPMIKEGVHCCPAKGLWDSLSTREIHHGGVVFHKCSMNQKEPLSPVPSEFAAILLSGLSPSTGGNAGSPLLRTRHAWLPTLSPPRWRICWHGLGKANCRYCCQTRIVHPNFSSQCRNELHVVLRLLQLLTFGSLSFTESIKYFLGPDSQLLPHLESEVPGTVLFPGACKNHQGQILVKPEICQAPTLLPLPTKCPH